VGICAPAPLLYARHVTGRIENHIAGTKLGDRRIASVRPSEVQAWATERSKHLSPTNLRNLVSMVRSIFRDAVLDRLCAENPAARITLPSYEKPLTIPLTAEQVDAIEDAIDDRCRAMVTVQAWSGVRIGELLALRVSDVDFLRKTIRVQYQFADTDSRVRTEPKTPRSNRVIPVSQFVIDAIADHLRNYPAAEDGTIFVTENGTAWRHDVYGSKRFKAAVKAAGVPESTTTHDLRRCRRGNGSKYHSKSNKSRDARATGTANQRPTATSNTSSGRVADSRSGGY
jgi:integrase